MVYSNFLRVDICLRSYVGIFIYYFFCVFRSYGQNINSTVMQYGNCVSIYEWLRGRGERTSIRRYSTCDVRRSVAQQ